MAPGVEKAALRRLLLARRDATSHDMTNIASKKIFDRLKSVPQFQTAKSIGCYYPTGSEVKTQDIILSELGRGRQICLPRVIHDRLEFRQINDLDSIELGTFGIMEPKTTCPICDKLDIVLVPAVGVSRSGVRLGYGHGYYDRFLSEYTTTSIVLSYAKQVIKSIPFMPGDIPVDFVVTEDESFKAP